LISFFSLFTLFRGLVLAFLFEDSSSDEDEGRSRRDPEGKYGYTFGM
jgi:hypothetical protein